jgi:biotin carboxyl carrier protein
MPGVVTKVMVVVGDESPGASRWWPIEAMKMEHQIRAREPAA